MPRLVLLALFAAALSAQSPAPPAKVDKALRARVSEFYRYGMANKFRDAEKLVAQDSRDTFYNSNKTTCLSFEIQTIEYDAKFTRAHVLVLCEQTIMMPGFAGRAFKLPNGSTWKLDKGKWFWFVDPNAPVQTPFGAIKPSQSVGKAPGSPADIPTTPDFALNKVTVDRQSVEVKRGESAELTFTNSAPGTMNVSIGRIPTGLEVTPQRAALPRAGQAVFTIKAGPDAADATLEFEVEPTGESILVKATIK